MAGLTVKIGMIDAYLFNALMTGQTISVIGFFHRSGLLACGGENNHNKNDR